MGATLKYAVTDIFCVVISFYIESIPEQPYYFLRISIGLCDKLYSKYT